MPGHVVGRDAERASIRDFVASVSDGAAALVLEGEAGTGKTTLWTAGVETAEEAGLRVLRARPGESETALSFAGVRDLLDPVLEQALEPLPAPQRRALSRALVLESDEGAPPDPHAVGVAVLNGVRGLAEGEPMLLAIDDVQWLDPASAGALAYAGRRLAAERVGFLLARRSSLESLLVAELTRALPSGRAHEASIGPLDRRALQEIVGVHLGVVLPRPLLAEVHEASGGNPFYALELVRMLQRSGASVEAGHPLPVPESLHDLVHARLLALPEQSRDFLLAAAAHAHPTVQVTEAASGVRRDVGLTPALEARVVELDRDRIRFTHPLLAAGAYEIADRLRRSAVHRRLAELLDDLEARAWQLAASTELPDEDVAAVLESAALHARSRGAPRPAALLLDRARELTPSDRPDDTHRRAIEAAYLHFESGDSHRAESQLRALVDELPRGNGRAQALVRLARVRSYEAQGEAADLFLQAVEEAKDDAQTLALGHEGYAACLFRLRTRLDESIDHAADAARIALEIGDERLVAEAVGSQLLAESLLGRETAALTAERALALQGAAGDHRVLGQPLVALGVHWWWTDRLDEARTAVLRLVARAKEVGDESSLPYLLVLLGQVEMLLGELEHALARAREGRDAAEQSGQGTLVAYHLGLEGLVEAQRGNAKRARAAALAALERVPETGGRPAELLARWALGHLELALGASEAAFANLEPGVALVREEGLAEPGALRFVVDAVEAAIGLGRRDEAIDILDWHEGNAWRLERASALASCLRCRGLLASQAGALDDALSAYANALEWHERAGVPLEMGRTLIALGAMQRRVKRRREARETLKQAAAVLDGIGAVAWADRAREELRRISGRAPSLGALTPAEERVAALVAEGRTNREVAAALYLSERTVEGHLSRVFGKLGVRSRTELARVLAPQGEQPVKHG